MRRVAPESGRCPDPPGQAQRVPVNAHHDSPRGLIRAELTVDGDKVTLGYRAVHADPLTTEAEGGISLKKIAPAERKF